MLKLYLKDDGNIKQPITFIDETLIDDVSQGPTWFLHKSLNQITILLSTVVFIVRSAPIYCWLVTCHFEGTWPDR